MQNRQVTRFLSAAIAMLALSGCATYVTPGGPADLSSIQSHDIRERMSREPAASFPAGISIVRIQASDYHSHSAHTYGQGAYVIETSRELMSEQNLEDMASWVGVRQVAPLGRLLIPIHLDSVDELRAASASLKTDVLIAYTLDTEFRIDERPVGPMNVISLGVLRSRDVVVYTTASAVLVDVRSGYVYGLAEASATERKGSNPWNSSSAFDRGRIETERDAFDGLVGALEKTWGNIVEEYALAASASDARR